VLQVLSEMIRSEELLRLVAFAKLVRVVEMLVSFIPVGRIGELLSTIPANISDSGVDAGRVEGGVRAFERSTRPGMAPKMERVLVTFSFILVLEPVPTESACVLLLGLVKSAKVGQQVQSNGGKKIKSTGLRGHP
jgi:hypothetical protein